MGNQRLHFIFGKLVGVRLHFFFTVFLQAFLDARDRLGVVHLGLDLGIGVVFRAGLPAHLGLAATILTVALGALFVPVLFGIRRHDAHATKKHDCQGAAFD